MEGVHSRTSPPHTAAQSKALYFEWAPYIQWNKYGYLDSTQRIDPITSNKEYSFQTKQIMIMKHFKDQLKLINEIAQYN